MKTKKQLLVLLAFCIAFFTHAQNTPRLLAAMQSGGTNHTGTIVHYNGGDTSFQNIFSIPANPNNYGTTTINLTEVPNGKLYGSNYGNGTSNLGSIFEFDYTTNTYTPKASFDSTTGCRPHCALLLAANGIMYGTTTAGGLYGGGTLFSYKADSNYVTKLADFASGSNPNSFLSQGNNGKLYGMTRSGGTNSSGTIFEYNIATSTLSTLYNMTNNASPYGGLLPVGTDTLYGLTYNTGLLFRFIPSTGSFTTLYTLGGFASPGGSVIRGNGDFLYGLTQGNGSGGYGTLFRYRISTSSYTDLHDFTLAEGKPVDDPFLASDGNIYSFTLGYAFKYNVSSGILTLGPHLDNTTGYNAQFGHFIEYIPTTAPSINQQPATTSVCENSLATVSARVSGVNVTNQWQVSTNSGITYSNITNATDTIYRFTTSASQNGNRYRLVSSNLRGADTSNAAILYVLPTTHFSQNMSICLGSSITVRGHTYSTAGIYLDTLHGASSNGCDSIITLTLAVNANAISSRTQNICQGSTYSFGGHNLAAAGVYHDTLTSSSGCDSIITLTLTVNPNSSSNQVRNICQGNAYNFGGHNLTAAGVYFDTLNAANTCDSIVTLQLTVDSIVAHFTLQPSGTAHLWYIVNQCSGNGLTYVWNWGDGATSSSDTPSHNYAAAGNYTVCVNATDSTGCTALYCDSNAYLYKNQGQMVSVNVVYQVPTGINTVISERPDITYRADAIYFFEPIVLPSRLRLYDLSGKVVMSQDNFAGNVWNINSGLAHGAYIIHLENDSYSLSRKIMITQ